jgi:uncharacterized membrane protein
VTKGRLEAFSDGVIAVIITIMVLELKAPHGRDLHALATLWPVFLSYVLSFVYVGIYWNNHHHIMRAVDIIDGRVMWANLHLLFWLSLIPFATAWLGDNVGAAIPTATYGLLLLLNAGAFGILTAFLVRCNGADSAIARAVGDDRKGRLSMLLYIVATISAFFFPILAYALYFAVATIWFVPDRRVERVLADEPPAAHEATEAG